MAFDGVNRRFSKVPASMRMYINNNVFKNSIALCRGLFVFFIQIKKTTINKIEKGTKNRNLVKSATKRNWTRKSWKTPKKSTTIKINEVSRLALGDDLSSFRLMKNKSIEMANNSVSNGITVLNGTTCWNSLYW
jgi:heme/copper-type cytochrome/quinol oxidase subunit 1